MKLSASIGQIWRAYGLEEIDIYAALRRCGFDCADYDFDTSEKASWRDADAALWGRDLRSRMLDVGMEPVVVHISSKEPFEEAALIAQAIRHCNGNLSEAGRELGISPRMMNYRMNKLKLKTK